MGNNGKTGEARPTRNTKRLAKIVFAGPIEDARGKEVRELYEDEASWRQHAEVVRVPIGVAPAPGPKLIGVEQPPQVQFIPVPIAGYQIQQDISATEFIAWFVPIAQVRCVRMPHEVVELRDARGDVAERTAVWCSKADEIKAEQTKRAEMARGESTEH